MNTPKNTSSDPGAGAAGDLSIRPSEARDLAAIRGIYAHHVRFGTASFEETPPDQREMARRRADILARGLPYLVAESAGIVIGFAYATPFRGRSAYRFTLESTVYVAPNQQRRGIGSRLMGEVIVQCEALGYRQMIAVIGDSANAASIGLHRSLGFEMAGNLVATGFKFGRWLDSVYMRRTLGSGDAAPPEK